MSFKKKKKKEKIQTLSLFGPDILSLLRNFIYNSKNTTCQKFIMATSRVSFKFGKESF